MAGKLVVESQVREMIKSHDLRVSSDYVDALNAKVESEIKASIKRALGNKRKTLDPVDL